MRLTDQQLDRAAGAVLASAAGDALGSQYEFGPSLADDITPEFGIGCFGHAIGEWTDDTSMAIPILEVLAGGRALEDAAALDEIVTRWRGWSETAKDVGTQTRSILSHLGETTAEAAFARSRSQHRSTGRSAGNGSLMRTGPVALGYLDRSPEELATAAGRVAQLTHWEDDNLDACAIWCLAIRHGILTGELDVRGYGAAGVLGRNVPVGGIARTIDTTSTACRAGRSGPLRTRGPRSRRFRRRPAHHAARMLPVRDQECCVAAAAACLQRIDADHLGRHDLPERRNRRKQWHARTVGGGPAHAVGRLEAAAGRYQPHGAEAEHVVAVAGHRRPACVGHDGRGRAQGLRLRWQRDLVAQHPERLREVRTGAIASSPLLQGGALYVQVLHGMKTDDP